MHEIKLDAAESAELLEIFEGEGSCSLAFDAMARLYDELASQPLGSGCLWRLSEPERQEILPELEECAETVERAALDRLVCRLQTLPSICMFETGEIASSGYALTSGMQDPFLVERSS